MDKTELHKDHRKRMRDRFKNGGISAFEEHEILEMMLFYALPRCNTNTIAHSLLQRFGDISGVLSAGKEELCSVDGVGESTAESLMFFGSVYMSITERLFEDVPLNTDDKAGMYAVMIFGTVPAGSAAVLYLDGDGRIISRRWLYKGEGKLTDALCGHIISEARENGAVSLILMHDHKNEPTSPSPEDTTITDNLRSYAETAGIKKVWHVIVTDDGYTHI